jgi:hypothetical protein
MDGMSGSSKDTADSHEKDKPGHLLWVQTADPGKLPETKKR